MKRINIVLSVMLVGVATVAMVSGAGLQDSAWEVPEEARAEENPIEGTAEVVEEGAVHYQKRCQMCHGAEGLGDGRMASRIKPAPKDISTPEVRDRMTDGEIFYKISVGKRPMPAMEDTLTEDEIWSVVHFVRSLQAD